MDHDKISARHGRLVQSSATGVVKQYYKSRGFGFIQWHNADGMLHDVLFHRQGVHPSMDIDSNGLRSEDHVLLDVYQQESGAYFARNVLPTKRELKL